MLQLFRNNTPYTVLLLFILTLLAKLQALSHPVAPVVADGRMLYTAILQLLQQGAGIGTFGLTIITVLSLFFQSLYLHRIAIYHKLYQKPTYLPAYCYILFTSLHPAFSSFSAAMLTNWAILVGLDIVLQFNQSSQPRKNIFNAGFALAIAALIEMPALGLLLFLLTSLLLLRSFNVGEWVVALLGYLSPLYFAAGILFLIDRLPALYTLPKQFFSFPTSLQSPVHTVGIITGTGALLLSGLITVQNQLNKSTMNIRRNWVNMICLLLFAFMVAIVTSGERAQWLIVMVPLSLITAYAFQMEKRGRFSNFTFYFSLLLLIFSQVALNR